MLETIFESTQVATFSSYCGSNSIQLFAWEKQIVAPFMATSRPTPKMHSHLTWFETSTLEIHEQHAIYLIPRIPVTYAQLYVCTCCQLFDCTNVKRRSSLWVKSDQKHLRLYPFSFGWKKKF